MHSDWSQARMERRRYLALLSVAFAGCNSLPGGGDQSTPDERRTGTGTGTVTGTGTETPRATTTAPTATETPTETATRRPTETTAEPTETETATATPAPDFDDYIATSRDALERAYDGYVEQAQRGSELRDVGCDVDFTAGPVSRQVTRARVALDDAADTDPSYRQEQLVEHLRDVATALDRFAIAQEAATRGCRATSRGFEAIYTEENVGKARRRLRGARDAAAAIDDAVDQVSSRSGIGGADFDAVAFMDGREFRDKREEFRELSNGLDSDLTGRLSELSNGFSHFVDGVDAYEGESYAAAEGYLDDAVEEFETVRREFDEVAGSNSFNDVVGAFTRALAKLIRGTEKLSEAAAEFQTESGATEQLQAKQRYRENANVESMPTVQRVLEL